MSVSVICEMMVRLKEIAFGLFFLLSAACVFGQNGAKERNALGDTLVDTLQVPSATAGVSSLSALKNDSFRKNILKINLSSFLLYNNSLSYERCVSRKTTVVVGYRYMPMTTVASAYLAKRIIDRYGEDEDLADQINSTMTGNSTVTGELRFYAGKKPGARGFYLSVYGRYMALKYAFPYEYRSERRLYSIPFNGTLKGFSGGLMIGSQWIIVKRITFDWYIFGGHFGKLKVDIPAKVDMSTMTADETRGLEDDIESINEELPGQMDVEASVGDDGVRVKGRAPFVGLRGLGFSLGIAF